MKHPLIHYLTGISMRLLVVLLHSGDCQMGLKIQLARCILRFIVANMGMMCFQIKSLSSFAFGAAFLQLSFIRVPTFKKAYKLKLLKDY